MNVLNDISHWYGGDLGTSPAGDLAAVSGSIKSQQRVLRRLFTPKGTYQSHPDYGGSLGGYVGALADIPAIQAAILTQMLLEASVAQNPPPTVVVTPITGGLQVAVSYTALPDQVPVSLNFQVPE
jgi:hypothetical protein